MTHTEIAIAKHGSAAEAVLCEDWESWPLGESMRLLAMMAREIAAKEVVGSPVVTPRE
jgi:hypothetical protein